MKRRKASLDVIHPRSLGVLSEQLQRLVRGRLWLQVMIAMVLGVATGALLVALLGMSVSMATALLGLLLILLLYLSLVLSREKQQKMSRGAVRILRPSALYCRWPPTDPSKDHRGQHKGGFEC